MAARCAVLQCRMSGVPGAVEDLSRDALRFQLETNVVPGTIELVNALPAMRGTAKRRILINSSILGFAAMPSAARITQRASPCLPART